MNCEYCGGSLAACIHAGEKMQVRHWWCPRCKHNSRAIGRERLLTVDDVDPVQASIEAFVEMRVERNT